MIAWAGLERFRLGLIDGMDFAARPRWPLDPGKIRAGTARLEAVARALKYLLLAGALVVAIEAPKPFLAARQTPIAAPVRVAYGPEPGFDHSIPI